MLYLWLKAAHIIFVVAWMAGMLVYPRYKIHQLSTTEGSELFETMKTASARLKKVILTPSMVLVWLLGISMVVVNPNLMSQGWLHIKLLLVLILSGLHGYLVALGRKVDDGTSNVSVRRLKIMNEVPFILLIFIVILVVLKPFM